MPRSRKKLVEPSQAEINEQMEKVKGMVQTGIYLRHLRQVEELSLAELGEILDVSAFYLSQIERGVKPMSDAFIRDICDHFGINESIVFNMLGRVPLLAREQLNESASLQELLIEIKQDKHLTEEQKQKLFDEMYNLYKNFPN